MSEIKGNGEHGSTAMTARKQPESHGVAISDPVRLEADFQLFIRELKQKYLGKCADDVLSTRYRRYVPLPPDQEAVKDLITTFTKCNDVRNSLRSSLEAQTIEASSTKNEYVALVNNFSSSTLEAIANEKALTSQDLHDLHVMQAQLHPRIDNTLLEEENMHKKCQMVRAQLADIEESINHAKAALNRDITHRTNLMAETFNVTAQREQLEEETQGLQVETIELQHRIEEDAATSVRVGRDLDANAEKTLEEAARLKQEHHERDSVLMALLSDLRETRGELVRLNTSSKRQVAALQSACSRAQETINERDAAGGRFLAETKATREKMAAEREKMAKRREESAVLLERVRESTSHCREQAAEHMKAEQEKKGVVTAIVKECRVLEKQRDKAERVLEGLVNRAREARDEMEWKNAEVTNLTIKMGETVEAMAGQRQESGISIMAEEAKCKKLEADLGLTQRERIATEQTLKHKQETLDQETKAFIDQKHHLLATAKEDMTLIAHFQAENRSHEAAIASSKAAIAACEEAISRVEGQVAALDKAHARQTTALRESIEASKQQARELDERDRATQETIARFNELFRDADKVFKALQDDEAAARGTLETRDKALSVLEEEHQRLSFPYNEAKERLESAQALRKRKLATYAGEMAILTYRLDLIKTRQAQFEGLQGRLDDAVEHLVKDNAYSRKRIEESKVHSLELRRQLRMPLKEPIPARVTRLPTTIAAEKEVGALLHAFDQYKACLSTVDGRLDEAIRNSSAVLAISASNNLEASHPA